MDNFFPEDVQAAAEQLGGNWLKASEFAGEGMTLKLSAPLEKIHSNNPKYGAQESDFLVKKEILEVGESFLYSFEDATGAARKLESKSSPLFIAFKSCEDLGVGEWVHITRTGNTTDTRFTVVKVPAPVSQETPDPKDIPF